MMRLDPQLTFLTKCGPPEELSEETRALAKNTFDMDDDSRSRFTDDDDSRQSGSRTPSERGASSKKEKEQAEKAEKAGLKPFPTASECNGRLRRLIAAYQRENAREKQRQAIAERQERIEKVMREREREKEKKLTKKEEAEFYRTLVAYGLEYSKDKRVAWDRFRALSRLDKKTDETMNEYLNAFMASCKKSLGIELTEEEGKQNYY